MQLNEPTVIKDRMPTLKESVRPEAVSPFSVGLFLWTLLKVPFFHRLKRPSSVPHQTEERELRLRWLHRLNAHFLVRFSSPELTLARLVRHLKVKKKIHVRNRPWQIGNNIRNSIETP